MLLSLVTISAKALDVVLPTDFFGYDINVNNNPEEGYFYTVASIFNSHTRIGTTWAVIMDNDGNIKWFRRGNSGCFPYPDLGLAAFADRRGQRDRFIIMDMTYTFIDTIRPANGYLLDTHDLLLFEDGTSWIMAQDIRVIDMSELVDGGNPEAEIVGFAIQELDSEGDVTWEYLTLDHQDDLPITDADTSSRLVSFSADRIDYLHYNAIELDLDGNVLLSARHFNEIHKIDYETQELLWRWGGGAGNMFDFVEDLNREDSAFYFQHDIRVLENGNYRLFDNGNTRSMPRTFIKEYALDEEAMTATLVWSYSQDPVSHSDHGGGAFPTSGGNMAIAWGGGRSTDLCASELTPDGVTTWELTFYNAFGEAEYSLCYRFHKVDMIGVAATPFLIEVIDENNVTLFCNWFGHEDDVVSYNIYIDENPNPVVLHGNTDTGVYEVNDLSAETDYYFRVKAVNGDGIEISQYSNEIIIRLDEAGIIGQGESLILNDFNLEQNYPNPFNQTTVIRVNMPTEDFLKLQIYDILGREVAMLHNNRLGAGRHNFSFTGSGYSSGIYFVKAYLPNGSTQVRKIIMMR
ncbi:MAG: aryl-sulfate sulfotransferase [Candidatus Electryonea clarkiae]|nr:aryl-sulfate sulfotransferase [Candidatus Electryonea clarkiae]MDP8288712.1 aryl-sulfate sulfotransferase [Candidatus Electryonea clarkiae]